MPDCVFCKIAAGAIPAEKVKETASALAFKDINPAAPVHVLLVPKKHFASVDEMSDEDSKAVAELAAMARDVARDLGVAKSGYRLVINCGPDGGQEVMHLHMHLLAGVKLRKMG